MALTLQSFASATRADAAGRQDGGCGPILTDLLSAREQTTAVVGQHLHATVERLAAEAVSAGVTHLYGASDAGQQLAGAAAFCAPSLRIWVPGTVAAVALVDAVIVSTAGLASAAGRLRSLGATNVSVFAVRVLRDGAVGDPAIDRIVVLDHTARVAA